MSAQSDRLCDRAFVVQFEHIEDGRRRLRGRVEAVASGEAVRFRSVKQLVAFMVTRLCRRSAQPEQHEVASQASRS